MMTGPNQTGKMFALCQRRKLVFAGDAATFCIERLALSMDCLHRILAVNWGTPLPTRLVLCRPGIDVCVTRIDG